MLLSLRTYLIGSQTKELYSTAGESGKLTVPVLYTPFPFTSPHSPCFRKTNASYEGLIILQMGGGEVCCSMHV